MEKPTLDNSTIARLLLRYSDLDLSGGYGRFVPKHGSALATLAQEVSGLLFRGEGKSVGFHLGKGLAAFAGCLQGAASSEEPQQGVKAMLTLAFNEAAHPAPGHVQG
jgi:hypothetical protein